MREFANWASLNINVDAQWLLSILSDDTHFSLHGTVNIHNNKILVKNIYAYTEKWIHVTYKPYLLEHT